MGKKINTTEVGTITLVYFFEKEYPMKHGNCFSLKGEDEKYYKIVNFNYENLKWALKNNKISFPIRIEILEGKTAIINDIRIPRDWYSYEYCSVCCPVNLLTEPQRKEIERALERGERTEMSVSDGLLEGRIIVSQDNRKHPNWKI